MYVIGCSSAADLRLGQVRFQPAVLIAPPPAVPTNLAGANCLGRYVIHLRPLLDLYNPSTTFYEKNILPLKMFSGHFTHELLGQIAGKFQPNRGGLPARKKARKSASPPRHISV